MTVYITGDVHARWDFSKFDYFQKQYPEANENDYVIICGDFGLIWNFQGEDDDEIALRKEYEAMPYTILFVDGNHECHPRLFDFPEMDMFGGKVHKMGKNIYHLMRGEIYTIEGKTYFCLGGAPSHDKFWRTPGESWWEEEVPNRKERRHALNNLAVHNYKVNYIITHDAPTSVAINLIFRDRYSDREVTEWGNWLDANIDAKVEFDRWYFGHYHIDTVLENGKYNCLYYRFVPADEGLPVYPNE